MEDTQGTFVVTHADEQVALLRDVETAQVHSVTDHPELEQGEIITGSLVAGSLGTTWTVDAIDERRSVSVERTDLEPTAASRETAAEMKAGELRRLERAGEGEVHVLGTDAPEQAAAEVASDPETVARAARLDAVRVEIRIEPDEFLTVRYLPD